MYRFGTHQSPIYLLKEVSMGQFGFEPSLQGVKMIHRLRTLGLVWFVGLSSLFVCLATARPNDKIMGEIQFVDANKVAKTSGVWVDGQYIDFLGALKGYSTLNLLPGEHENLVPQYGYGAFT